MKKHPTIKIVHLALNPSFNTYKELDSVVVIQKTLYVTKEYLLNQGMSEADLPNRFEKFAKEKIGLWQTVQEYINRLTVIFISFKTIPLHIREKYKLPDIDQVQVAYQNSLKKATEELKLTQQKEVSELMVKAFNYEYKDYLKYYRQFDVRDAKKSIQLARTHALLAKSLEIQRYKLASLDVTYERYLRFPKLTFRPKHIKSFYRKLKVCKDDGVQLAIVHGLTEKESNNTKFSIFHESLIRQAIKSRPFYTYGEIKKRVDLGALEIGEPIISLSTIKAFLRREDVRNECYYFRFGKNYADTHIFPYIPISHQERTGKCRGYLDD